LVPLKNLRLLIEAFGLVRRNQRQAHLVIVGEGPELAGLRAQVAGAGIDGAVSFVPYVPQADTPAYYRSADVFALSSDFDNSPNVVLEAMACGRPVVALRRGGAAEVVREGTGILFDEGDGALEAALAELSRRTFDPARLRRHAQEFDRASFRERMESLLVEAWEAFEARDGDPWAVERRLLATQGSRSGRPPQPGASAPDAAYAG
jgi:glycosyltransferase involved in cell wall biosynthesis